MRRLITNYPYTLKVVKYLLFGYQSDLEQFRHMDSGSFFGSVCCPFLRAGGFMGSV